MKYVLTAKELTELAKEVAAATADPDLDPFEARKAMEAVFIEHGISWDEPGIPF